MKSTLIIFFCIVLEVEICFSSLISPNLSLHGKVSQSSLYGPGIPERAIDGNPASNWADNSCTHTQDDLQPWWRLDLQKAYKVNQVKITNRKDCCSERLNGAEIRIGNSLNDNGNSNPRCAAITSIPPGATNDFNCNGMEGRYINIVIPGRKEYLTLCEVEVFGTESIINSDGPNLAPRGKVVQSSLYGPGIPERAIDGNPASNWADNSCSCTQDDLQPWWRLDLQKTYKVNKVKITNRKDCCSERLNGAEIRIGNSLNDNGNSNARCAVITSILAGTTNDFNCNGMKGRYVNIVIPGRKEYLTLCEVEVFGTESVIGSDGTNLALHGNVAQSSLYGPGIPERAIDGNTASNWAENSCTHTQDDLNPWWILDLQNVYKVNQVKITNRKDCCSERLNGAEIRIGNSLDNNGNSNPRCAVITSIPAGTTSDFNCNGMEGRYINIVIPGRKEYLTLCEVEIFGINVSNDVVCG